MAYYVIALDESDRPLGMKVVTKEIAAKLKTVDEDAFCQDWMDENFGYDGWSFMDVVQSCSTN